MTDGSNPAIDGSKLGTKRYNLPDKESIPLSVVISSAASTPDVKLVTKTGWIMQLLKDIFNILKQKMEEKEKEKEKQQYLCLDKAYKSTTRTRNRKTRICISYHL